ncbi:MAG TPA: hypothetical protein VGD81_08105 [Opitutaceae bacterium]
MHTSSSTPGHSSRLPIVIEVLILVGLVLAICLLPTNNKTPSKAAAAHTDAK